MNKCILLNTVLALSIPSIFGFPAIPALAYVQPQVPSIQNQQVTIPQSWAITVTFPIPVTFDSSQTKSLPTTAFVSQTLLASSGNLITQEEVNCNSTSSDTMVKTSAGFVPVSVYCQDQSDNYQQPVANTQTTPPPPWREPYWSNGNVCRERSADTVCLTPQEATNLRWLPPSR